MSKTGKVLLLSAAIAAALTFLMSVQMPNHTQLWRELTNSGHAVLFGGMAVAILMLSWQLLRKRFPHVSHHYLIAFVATIGLGAATEIIQLYTARDADIYDFLMDTLGAASFLCLVAAFDRRLRRSAPSGSESRRKIGLTLAGLCFIALAFLSPGIWATAMIARTADFPVICGFDSYWETKWIHPIRATLERIPPPAGFTTASGLVGKFTTLMSRYPKLEFIEVDPDWRGYSSLSLDIYSELDESVNLAIRIDDVHHNDRFEDRFNRRMVVKPGLNHFAFSMDEIRTAPKGREMDLEHITHLLVFAVYPRQPFTVYIDNLRLQ
jgi:VanZ family protein